LGLALRIRSLGLKALIISLAPAPHGGKLQIYGLYARPNNA